MAASNADWLFRYFVSLKNRNFCKKLDLLSHHVSRGPLTSDQERCDEAMFHLLTASHQENGSDGVQAGGQCADFGLE